MTATVAAPPTYKIVPLYTVDEYKIQDILPYVMETGARTEAELVAVVLRLWLDERDFFARGLCDWLFVNGLPMRGWNDPAELTADEVARVRALVATEAGRRGFLDAIQSAKNDPFFFVLPGAGNLAAEFLLHLAMENCEGRMVVG